MLNNYNELINRYLEEIERLDVKRKDYRNHRNEAIIKRTYCMADGDYAGATAWDNVKYYYVDKIMLVNEQIKNLYMRCISLKTRIEV